MSPASDFLLQIIRACSASRHTYHEKCFLDSGESARSYLFGSGSYGTESLARCLFQVGRLDCCLLSARNSLDGISVDWLKMFFFSVDSKLNWPVESELVSGHNSLYQIANWYGTLAVLGYEVPL